MAHRPEHLASGSSPPERNRIMRCDQGHDHDTLEAATACVRVTKPALATSPLVEPRSLESSPEAARVAERGGRPRLYASNAARQAAYRQRRRAE
jgi:hypothetical protein